MTKVLNSASRPVDLDGGRTLAPGEEAEIDLDNTHNKTLINQGLLVKVEEPKKTRREPRIADETTGEETN